MIIIMRVFAIVVNYISNNIIYLIYLGNKNYLNVVYNYISMNFQKIIFNFK